MRSKKTVDLGLEQGIDVLFFAVHFLARLANHHIKAGLAGQPLDAVHHSRKKRPVDVRHNHAQHVAAAAAQRGGHAVGLVVQLFGQGPHLCLGGLAHVPSIVERPRNGRRRQAQFRR
jgi:hypothetical protein